MHMCQAIARQGHDVTLHAQPGDLPAKDAFAFYGVERCFRIVKPARPAVRVLGAVVHAWRTRTAVLDGPPPDIIYARDFWALSLLSHDGIPFVFESHWSPMTQVHKAVETSFLRHKHFRRIVFISNALREVYSQRFPWFDLNKSIVAHDAADPVPLGTAKPSVPNDRLQVGYVGSFWPGYGLDMVERLAIRLPEADFHLVGGDPHQVAERQDRPQVPSNLIYHGFLPPAELPTAYASFDVLLAPYQPDTPHIRWISPMKLFEYMSHGKAIVCSDFPVMREILQHGENGLLVRPDKEDAWLDGLLQLRDRATRVRLGAAARAKLELEFTWDIRARRILDGVT